MTGVSYTYTNAKGEKVTTTSYEEFKTYRAKNAPANTVYTPIYEEPIINPERKRRKLV